MPFNARASLELLVDSGKLDGLLAEANKLAAARGVVLEDPAAAAHQLDEFAKRAAEVTAESRAAARDLVDALHEREQLRAEKVAIVRHMLAVGSRLV
jgi:hypothetical protein